MFQLALVLRILFVFLFANKSACRNDVLDNINEITRASGCLAKSAFECCKMPSRPTCSRKTFFKRIKMTQNLELSRSNVFTFYHYFLKFGKEDSWKEISCQFCFDEE